MSFTAQGQQVADRLSIAVSVITREIMEFTADVAGKTIPQAVKTRVTSTGIGYDKEARTEKEFSPYSSRQHISKRNHRGLNVAFKDFSFSGGMWNSLQVVEQKLEGDGFIVRLGFTGINTDADRAQSRGKKNEDIMLYHSEREGFSIMHLTPEEIIKLETAILNKVEDYIYAIFNKS